MEAGKRSVSHLLVAGLVMGFMSACGAYDFYVGGNGGWVLNPSESLNHWAERNRFQVNDRLVFKYKKWEDAVLVVSEEDYDVCNATDPIERLEGGDSVFELDRSGPFFFISGAPGRCDKGQKMVVVVMAVRDKKRASPPFAAITEPPTSSGSPDGSPADGTGSAPAASTPSSSAAAASVVSALGASLGLVALALGGAFLP